MIKRHNQRLACLMLVTVLQTVVIGGYLLDLQVNRRYLSALIAEQKRDVPSMNAFLDRARSVAVTGSTVELMAHIDDYVHPTLKVREIELRTLQRHLESQGNPLAICSAFVVLGLVWINYFTGRRSNGYKCVT